MDALTALAVSLDRSRILDAVGLDPDGWQRAVLRSTSDKILINCHRQAGKSTATAALAVVTALDDPGLVLMTSPSLRQSRELFAKSVALFDAICRPVEVVEETATALTLANGSRVVSLPGNPDTLRGFSAPKLIIVDEAARVADAMLAALVPMLGVSRGRLVALSTPCGRRGWFSDGWHGEDAGWERVRFTAPENPRIDPGWLAEQRATLGDRWYRQEFLCEFVDTSDQVFDTLSVDGAFDPGLEPLTLEGM